MDVRDGVLQVWHVADVTIPVFTLHSAPCRFSNRLIRVAVYDFQEWAMSAKQ